MSLVFYGWWRPVNILIIGPSILINFALSSYLLRLSERGDQPGLSRAVLLLGILFNILFLGFFKYADFVYGTINDVFGANFILLHIILPLGISFITFQKIAFLIDVQAGRVKAFTFREYCTFVLFFPQLVAGPIVHYREMMPQFATATCRFDKENFAVGLTLLFFGLFKKGVLADNIAPLVTPIYEHSAAAGHTPFSAGVVGGGSGSRCSSISTSPAIPTWRSGSAGSSASSCRRTSTRRSRRRASSISGSAGT